MDIIGGGRMGKYIVWVCPGRKMIFWGQYIVSPRAQTTQTIPREENGEEMCFFSLILKPGQKVEFGTTI